MPTVAKVSAGDVCAQVNVGASAIAASSASRCQCAAVQDARTRGEGGPKTVDGGRAHGWGLPSHGCPGNWTRYFTDVYPRLHREWMAQDRVVVHCSPSAGLGNYLRSLPSALIYSMATEQALVLDCDDPPALKLEKASVKGSMLPRQLAHFFRGPHFDWHQPVQLPANAPTVLLDGVQMNPSRWARNASGSRVVTTFFTHARRVLLFSKGHDYYRRAFRNDEILGKDVNLDGCLLRYLLAPRAPMLRAVVAATGVPAEPTGLMPLAAMHVRSGDKAFASAEWAKTLWYAAAEVRGSPFDVSPSGAFACLERLSDGAISRGGGGGGDAAHAAQRARHGAKSPEPSGECLGCVVLSDSQQVEAGETAAPQAAPVVEQTQSQRGFFGFFVSEPSPVPEPPTPEPKKQEAAPRSSLRKSGSSPGKTVLFSS